VPNTASPATPFPAKDTASLLLDARRTGQRIAALPERLKPQTMDDAYAVQAIVLQRLDDGIAGYKIAAQPDGVNVVAPILASLMVWNGATRSIAPNDKIAIELEFGFRFSRDVAADADEATIFKAIDATVVTIELCDTRYTSLDGRTRPEMTADFFSSRGAVPGTAIPFDPKMNFKGAKVRQIFDGVVNNDRTDSHPNGNPLFPLALLPKALAERGYHIKAGHFVITGSLTGMTWVDKPTKIIGEIDGFGKVSVNIGA
jgi:2-keto-4-pentenoate hydratase